ncbi:hypothetical protein ACE6H2_015197 [Prunus campanulata]
MDTNNAEPTSTPSLFDPKSLLCNQNRSLTDPNSQFEHMELTLLIDYVKGSCFYEVLHDLFIHGIFNVDGNLLTIQRKIASHEFNTKSLKHFISNTINFEISNHLIPYLSEICDENRVIDLQNLLRKFRFDNICNVAYGTDPACLDLENTHQTQSIGTILRHSLRREFEFTYTEHDNLVD